MRPWVAVVLALPGPLAAQDLRFDGGIAVASGTYVFGERTTTWTLSGGLGVELGRFTLRGSLPFQVQNSTLVAAVGPGHLPTGGSSSGAVSDSGANRHHGGQGGAHGEVEVPRSATTSYRSAVGDPLLGLSWLAGATRTTTVALGAVVKVPVADTATYGTGAWDLGASLGLSRLVSADVLVGLDIAYWLLGDMEDLILRNQLYGTISLGYLNRNGWGATVLGSGGSSAMEGYEPPIAVGAGFHRLAGSQAWSALAMLGLSETAPDFTVGGLWSVRLTP
jgi:hypothetical protein